MKVRTSVLRGFALLALSSLTFAACDEKVVPEPPAVTVTVSPQAVTVPVGGQTTLVAFVGNSTNQGVTWQSTNTAIATVDANGVVRGIAPGGPVTIIATSAADPNARAAASVTVTPGAAVTLTLVPQTAQAQIGGTVQLVGIVGNSANQTVNYTSSAPTVATVTPTGGLVTGVSVGTAVITARTAADPNVFQTSTITVTTGPGTGPAQISVTPSTATVMVGGSQTYVANVSGVSNTAVTWRNETPTIASFTQNGNNITATGLAAGTAIFTAISAADTTRRVQATMTVTAAPPETQPAISIQSVTYVGGPNAGQAVVSGAVIANQNLRVVVNVAAGSAARIGRVEVRLGEQVACQQVFSPALSQTQGVQSIECVINTTQLNAQGQPLFPNAVYNLSAVAFNEAGTPVATAQWGTLVLSNVNVLQLQLTTQPVTSTGPQFSGGLQWHEGNVVVRASPVLFTGGQTVGSVQLCIQAVDGPQQTPACRPATLTDGWWTATFPKANAPTHATSPGSAGITTTQLGAYGSSTFTTGATGPNMAFGAGPVIALDNVAPAAPPVNTFAAGTWVGGNYQFNRTNITGLSAAGLEALEVQPGVGGVTIEYFAFAGTEAEYTALGTSVGARNAAVVAQGTQVTSGANLAGTDQPSGYILVARVRDALNNNTLTRVPGTFGVDLVAPDFNLVQNRLTGSPAPMTINPATAFQFEFPFVAGNVSGTVLNPEVRIIRYTSNPASTRCVDTNTHADTAVPTTGGCPFVQSASLTVPVPAADGYYEFTFRFRDNAGNVSATQTVVVLRDNTAPVVTLAAGFSLTPTAATISATITDNVDLRSWDMRNNFAGAPLPAGANGATGASLPVAPATQIGSFGFANRVGSTSTGSVTVPIWRSLQVTDQGTGGLTSIHPVTGVGIGAFDIARNYGAAFMAVTQGAPAAGPAGMDQLNISLSGTSFCNGITPAPSGDQGINCSTTSPQPATRTVTVAASGPAGFIQPFTAVHVYRVDPKGNVHYVGQASFTASGSVGTRFEHRYTVTANAAGWQGDADVANGATPDGAVTQQIFAVGVTADRDAVRSPTRAITVFGAHRQP